MTASFSSLVINARQQWIQKLIDTSRRNNLLYYRHSKTTSLDLSAASTQQIQSLLSEQSLPIHKLLPPPLLDSNSALGGTDQVANTIVNIRRRAQANLEDKGIETLYLTMGMATWKAKDGGRNAESAILLFPATIELRGRDGRNSCLKLTGEPQLNLALAHLLRDEFGIKLNEEQLLTMPLDKGGQAYTFDAQIVYERLKRDCKDIVGFDIKPRLILGNFSFQKMSMVRDLQEYDKQLDSHPIIRALAGDQVARQTLLGASERNPISDLNVVAPEKVFSILNSDSSQQKVIMAVCNGQTGVIQGPPGTGKSQTIVNMIAELAAQGKRVLFVAEKRAALEVVKDRLTRVGLQRLVIDLHGAEINQRDLMQRVAENLSQIRDNSPAVDIHDQHSRYVEARKSLNEHVARLHVPRNPTKHSVYELQGKILRDPSYAKTSLRWRGNEISNLIEDKAREIDRLLEQATAVSDLITRKRNSYWVDADMKDGDTAQHMLDLAQNIAHNYLPVLRQELQKLTQNCKLPYPNTLNEAFVLLKLLSNAKESLNRYAPEIFAQNLAAWLNILEPASGIFSSLWADLTNKEYRLVKKRALELRFDKNIKPNLLKQEIAEVAFVQSNWRSIGDLSVLTQANVIDQKILTYALQNCQALSANLEKLVSIFPEPITAIKDINQMQEWLKNLLDDANTAQQIPYARQLESELRQVGMDKLLDDLKQSNLDADKWRERFHYARAHSILDAIRASDSKLSAFNGRVHDNIVTTFTKLDEECIKVNTARVLRAHAERVVSTLNAYQEQHALIKRESEKRSRHLPLRKLIEQAPNVITALFPCWMASPLSVSQLLDGKKRYFDVVLFDEASQILPEDAVCAILRADNVVVAGDKHQLPPTQFFASSGDEDSVESEDETTTKGYESLLDVMQSFLSPWMLEWHYRSKDESLIAFSNRHIYQDRLITFPGANGSGALKHILVQGLMSDHQTNSNSSEVNKVVELILEHAKSQPNRSLGVIAMGIEHAKRIQAVLDTVLNEQIIDNPSLADFFSENNPERFFIKNLERVQGDERDVIILTIGYGKDASGKLPYRFGPLLSDGGERRLNVAITRARYQLVLVSSFDDTDMDPNRSRARGVDLLRRYIQFARENGRSFGDIGISNVALNPFEADVYDALTSKGMAMIPQWGSGRYRIDFAVQHPDSLGKFILAIECDGASYHSSPSACDRDRLRQQQLQALGWRFHRIWSTDWFLRRDEEIARAYNAYQQALNTPTSVSSHLFNQQTIKIAQLESRPLPRLPKPNITLKARIDDYSVAELKQLVNWIKSDDKLRTQDELIDIMVKELGFARRGPRIVSVLKDILK